MALTALVVLGMIFLVGGSSRIPLVADLMPLSAIFNASTLGATSKAVWRSINSFSTRLCRCSGFQLRAFSAM